MGKGEIVCSNDVCQAKFSVVIVFVCLGCVGEGMLPLLLHFYLHPSSSYPFLRFVVDSLRLPSTKTSELSHEMSALVSYQRPKEQTSFHHLVPNRVS